MDDLDQEAKFLKSAINRRTENAGLAVLLRDHRHQVLPVGSKRLLLQQMGVPNAPHQAFDAIRTENPGQPVTPLTIPHLAPTVRLVEMKTTRKPIQDSRLQGFFLA